jgi:prepilin-type N-terminal cleavage/methylation domain-containing protein
MLKSPIKPTGFTLIESAIAIFILLVGLVAVIAFFPFGIKIVGESQSETFAANLAQSKVEELKATNYDSLAVGTIEAKHRLSSDASDPLYDYQRQTIVQTVDSNLNTNATDVGLKKVTITVYWISSIAHAERSYSMSTLVSDF